MFWHWDKGSWKAASEGPTVPNIHFCSLSNLSKKNARDASQDPSMVFHKSLYGWLFKEEHIVDERLHIIIKAQIFLEAVLTIETIQELQSNFEEKNSFSNSKLL